MTGELFARKMRSGKVFEEIVARGHENISALHRTTLEITKEKEMTPRGDCIIGVDAERSVRDLNQEIKERIWSEAKLEMDLVLPDYNMRISFSARGSRMLPLTHETDVVVRKSRFTCSRTLCIESDISAGDLDREFVELLRDRRTEIIMRIYA